MTRRMPRYYLIIPDPQGLLDGEGSIRDWWHETEASSGEGAAEVFVGILNGLWRSDQPPLLPWTTNEILGLVRPVSEEGLWL